MDEDFKASLDAAALEVEAAHDALQEAIVAREAAVAAESEATSRRDAAVAAINAVLVSA